VSDVGSGHWVVELPDNVKPNLGRDTVIRLPWNTEKSKLSIIKATVCTKCVAKERENAVSDDFLWCIEELTKLDTRHLHS
jgi:hypothetical protein